MNKPEIDVTELDYAALKENFPNRWRNVKEVELADTILKRFNTMRAARQSSCPFPSPKNALSEQEFGDIVNKQSEGYSWEDFWDNQQNLALMKHHYIKGRPNMKAATSFSPIRAAINSFRKYRLGSILKAEHTINDPIVVARQKSLDFLESEQDIQETKVDTFEDSITIGSGFEELTYLYKVREVTQIITDAEEAKAVIEKIQNDEDITATEKKKIIRKLKKKIEKGRPIEQKVKHIDYNDVTRIYRDPREVYIDPNAECLRGNKREAVDCIIQEYPSVEQFKAEYRFNEDPYLIQENIANVMSAQKASTSENKVTPFFKTYASDDTTSKIVDVKKYYNKQTDKFIILANDIVIRKGPIPYKHKELPIIEHLGIKVKGCLYGVGLPYFLEGIQSSDEATRNFYLMLLYQQLQPPILRNKMAFQGINFNRFEAGKIYDVNGSVGPENIRWFEGNGARMDFFSLKNILDQEAIKIAGINSSMSALPSKGEPVRNNMMTMETSLDSIRAMVANWGVGEKEAIRQTLLLQDQYYPIYKKEKDDKKENKYQTIRLEKTRLSPKFKMDDSDNIIGVEDMVEETTENDSDFELHPVFFTIGDKIRITVDIAQFPLVSEALQINNLKDVVTTLMPLRGNPAIKNDPVSNAMQKALIKAIKPSNMQDILNFYDDDFTADDLQRAEEQTMKLIKGESVVGVPGENIEHLNVHYKALLDLNNKVRNPKITVEQQSAYNMAIQNLSEHAHIDEMPRDIQSTRTITPPPPQPQMGPGMMPPQQSQQGGQMPPAMMGGGMPQQIGPSMGGQMAPTGMPM